MITYFILKSDIIKVTTKLKTKQTTIFIPYFKISKFYFIFQSQYQYITLQNSEET